MQKEEGDLAVRTKSFALQIIRLFSALPKTTEAQVIGKQVLRSGTSVGANYREAYRGRSKAEWSERGERHRRYSREVAESESEEERINLSRSVATRFGNWKRRPTGLNCSSMERSSHRKSSQLCAGNATNSSRFS